jgi:hypothetical protein
VPKIDDHDAVLHWQLPAGAEPRDVMRELLPKPCELCGRPLEEHTDLRVTWERDEVGSHEEDGLRVIGMAEQLLGQDRFGGAWIDRSAVHSVIGIAIVDPTQADVDAIDAAARPLGWPVQIVAARHSRTELIGLIKALDETLPGDAWISLGWDPRLNSIRAELRRWDEEAVSWARDRFPVDALTIVVQPGARASAM